MTHPPVIARNGEDSFASLGTGCAIPKKPVIAKREALWQSQRVAPLNEIAALPTVTRNDRLFWDCRVVSLLAMTVFPINHSLFPG